MFEQWQFWVDRGGTFTDIIALSPQGDIFTHKLLSENPKQYQHPTIKGIQQIVQTDKIPTALVKMGTTIATNALLERKGDPAALFITKGFKDALRIGYQNRPKLFELDIQLPSMLYQIVQEVDERVDAHGNIIQPLNLTEIKTQLELIKKKKIKSLAIVLMHAYRYPQHENQIANLAKDMGFACVITSHQASPLMKFISRGDTTMADAYLTPMLQRYVNALKKYLKKTRIEFMQSNGGLCDVNYFHAKDSILSGPAAGVVGAVETAKFAGFSQLITFDMGGTSTDVAHYNGEYERNYETEIGGLRLRVPMLDIKTIAAGGGSVIQFKQERFQVGPESAGANPGPACYLRGGPLTITDCNVLLGKINPNYFPKVFGKAHNETINIKIVREKFKKLTDKINKISNKHYTTQQVAEGFIEVAVNNMANAIKKVSIQRGHNIANYTLCCFGGAAGQHACQVADVLGLRQVLIHPFAGVLSALGMGLASTRVIKKAAVEKILSAKLITKLTQQLKQLQTAALNKMVEQQINPKKTNTKLLLYLKYQGSNSLISIAPTTNYQQLYDTFNAQHLQIYGYVLTNKPLIVQMISAEVIENIDIASINEKALPKLPEPEEEVFAQEHVTMFSHGNLQHTPIYLRKHLPKGYVLPGPAIVIEDNATTIVEPHWQLMVSEQGNLVLTREIEKGKIKISTEHADPVQLEIFHNLFMSIAEQMGEALLNTAFSINIKERHDFSCAIFDCQGNLIANAPHIPVHLGSMGESVREIIKERQGTIKYGDVYMLNNPYHGGTHLPDITVITPYFLSKTDEHPFIYVASRGHHAEIGGITPGSMPPDSKNIDEEGILITNFKAVDQGVFQEEAIIELFTNHPYPSRNPQQNLIDLEAQIAANQKGISELQKMLQLYELKVIKAYMQFMQDNAANCVRAAINQLQPGEYTTTMDCGSEIKVSITINSKNQNVHINFTGTSDESNANFNAPISVAKAAVLYVFRTLVQQDIPLNEGCLKPLTLTFPEKSLLNPTYPKAVVAGNVETSQNIVDALYAAMGLLAHSQGSMNNFTFGNEEFQYYETICGGAGAGFGFDGKSAIHTHMTNSLLTDPEVLEWRFPVMVDSFSVRKNSGGHGQWHGGDGVIRKIKFLQAVSAAILSEHRHIPPAGVNGGESGKPGKNYVIKANGEIMDLAATARVDMSPGDVFVIETPGGGGFGK